MNGYVQQQWRKVAMPEVLLHDSDYFIFETNSQSWTTLHDYKRISNLTSWKTPWRAQLISSSSSSFDFPSWILFAYCLALFDSPEAGGCSIDGAALGCLGSMNLGWG
ncbi:hypothetical protein Droror1_Dr00020856 [Drosera rotundifolia]